ncbi:peptidase [Sporosarcina thermotolerans]|uniref:Peptidase n=1 Tax=Sporosarcina thermotolerans TaxID=633404 RepID=A0AAW9A7W0_9BACL|nr:peptidase [Sporosarcina thermotolerans]MDW0117497.1 peptidase [Sporosarcina thermotolerans]WHT49665.1 peptidase [Sporosarcina thermotolerans]
MKITLQSQFTLYPLTIRIDKKNYIVEEPVSGDFFEMPAICIDAIERINSGQTLGEIELILRENYPDEDVDMMEFGGQLIDLGLVQEVDGEKIPQKKEIQKTGGFTWIPSSVGRFFFNGFSNKIYIILLLINISLIVWNPKLFPHYQDIFLFDSMMLNIITYMLISLVLIIIHEFGHILAIRSYDLPAKLGIGNRLIFVVFETDLTAAWKLKPRQRNILYFAGMSFEQLCMLIALSIQLLFPEANAIVIGILGIVVFDIFIKTLYQCCFYMKTDVYYFVENSTGCYNLMENGKQYLSKWLPFLRSDSTDTEAFDGEQRVVRMYSVFYLIGILLTLSLIVFYFLPQAYYAYSQVFSNLLWSTTPSAFWDAIAFLGQTVILLGLFIYSKFNKG